jgi:tRNA modification GTPase
MERTAKSVESADLVLAVLDSSSPLNGDDSKISALVKGKKGIAVWNKCDLPSKMDEKEAKSLFKDLKPVKVSALEGKGIEEMAGDLAGAAVPSFKNTEDEAVVCSIRHRDCLVRAEESLMKASALLKEGPAQELLAFEVHEALDVLGEMAGETASEDVLKEIFSKFCIGK